MSSLPGWLLRHVVTVEPLEGEGPFGPLFGQECEVRCMVDDKRRLVRDASGSEVLSETTVYAPVDTAAPVGSRITLPDGRQATVLQALRRDAGGLPTPDHLEVALT